MDQLCENKNALLFDGRFYTIDYNFLIEQINTAIYIFSAWVYPDENTIDIERVISFTNLDANMFISKIDALKNKAEETMNSLITHFGKDYWAAAPRGKR
jgi:hypothetical protein